MCIHCNDTGVVSLSKVGECKTIWSKTDASHAIPLLTNFPTFPKHTRALHCKQIISQSQDSVKLEDFVIMGYIQVSINNFKRHNQLNITPQPL